MLLLGDRDRDRDFAAAAGLVEQWAATGAHLLVRCKSGRSLPVIIRLPDGSFLSRLGTLTIRVIDAQISVTAHVGARTGHYRLITSLTDPRRSPARDLVTLYHERWEVETAYAELKSTLLAGRVLRARTPTGVEQEIYALLIAYKVLRTAMTDATDTVTNLDPDRAGFIVVPSAARDQLILAAGITHDTIIDLDRSPDSAVHGGPRSVGGARRRSIVSSLISARGGGDGGIDGPWASPLCGEAPGRCTTSLRFSP